MMDAFDLDRFVAAQESVYATVVHELSSGRKRSHWMWFVFPQIVGLGRSPMARRYAIGSIAEAVSYLDHAVLGLRLLECTHLVVATGGPSLAKILGSPDDLKFRSSMTLFDAVSGIDTFADAIRRFCPDGRDPATIDILERMTR